MSKIYFKQVKKIELEGEGGLNREYHFKRKKAIADRHKAMIEASESSDIDEDGELVDTLFAVQNFGTTKDDEKKAAAMLKRYEAAEEEYANIEKNESEETKFQAKGDDNLEELNKEANEKNDITTTYKLYNYVNQENKGQILRYLQPSIFREYSFIEPLWAS